MRGQTFFLRHISQALAILLRFGSPPPSSGDARPGLNIVAGIVVPPLVLPKKIGGAGFECVDDGDVISLGSISLFPLYSKPDWPLAVDVCVKVWAVWRIRLPLRSGCGKKMFDYCRIRMLVRMYRRRKDFARGLMTRR